MLIISESVNGLFKSVGRAIDDRDPKPIVKIVERQEAAGANAFDVNVGPGRGKDAPGDMAWLVGAVQGATKLPLCIDAPDTETMAAGLAAAENPTIINSTTAEPAKMDALFPMAVEHGSDIICLTMDEKGVPNDADSRAEMAMVMLMTAMEHGIGAERVLFDPLVLPVCAAQDQGPKVIEAIRSFQILSNPAPRTVVGLSNISNGASGRSLINRTFLPMLVGAGLSAVILDPDDGELMETVKTCEVLMDRKLYCTDYLRD
ncbi:MAG: dihydropteroate synthase [Thermoplasmatales archaeon]|nr:dihydropteroate synthase [Thermoplasmatales archaeon]